MKHHLNRREFLASLGGAGVATRVVASNADSTNPPASTTGAPRDVRVCNPFLRTRWD